MSRTTPIAYSVIMLIAALIIALVSGCGGGGGGGGGGTPAAGNDTITGKIVDNSTGAGIAGYTITFGTASTTTASDGTYTLVVPAASFTAPIQVKVLNGSSLVTTITVSPPSSGTAVAAGSTAVTTTGGPPPPPPGI